MSRLAAAAGVCLLLALLDLVGAYFAKEWSLGRSWVHLMAGCLAFLALFVAYALGLTLASLTMVTLGWIVLLQLGVVVMDRVLYGQFLSATQLAGICVILCGTGLLGISGGEV